MKVLLIGDYSGVHVNLKRALKSLGYTCILATDGDGFKEISKSDLYFPKSKNFFIRRIRKILFLIFGLKKYYGYDVVQLINPNIFDGTSYYYNQLIIKLIKKHNKSLFLLACGTDYYVYKDRLSLKYNPYDDAVNIDSKGKNRFTKLGYINNNKLVVSLVNKVIPSTYTYSKAYSWSPKLTQTIPFPLFLEENIPIKLISPKNKYVIFHGINRKGFKGSKYIIEAMNRIKDKYPDKVEIIVDGLMPLNKYLQLIKNVDIVIDQCLSYEYGMNAVYSMAMGKVVLSGNEIETQIHFQRSDIPIINILPSADDIFDKLERLIFDPNKILELSKKSRIFVEEFHDSIKVANQFIQIWNNTI
jgi:hypothetical protein